MRRHDPPTTRICASVLACILESSAARGAWPSHASVRGKTRRFSRKRHHIIAGPGPGAGGGGGGKAHGPGPTSYTMGF